MKMKGHTYQLIKNYFSPYVGLERLAWHGIILSLIESIFIGIYYFLPLYFVKHFGYTLVDASFIISFFGIGTIIGGYLGGRLSDRYSAKIIIILSLVSQSMIFLSLINPINKIFLCFSIFLMGFFSYTFITAIHLWVLQNCGLHSGTKLKAINILSVASNIGLAISAMIMGFYVGYNFDLIFIIGSVIFLLLAFYFFNMPSQYGNSKKKISTQEINIPKLHSTFRYQLILILICTLFMGFIIFQANTTYAVYLQDKFPEYGMKALSILFAVNCLLVVFLQAQIVGWFDKFNKILTMGLGALLIGIGTMILNFSYVFSIAVLSCVIYTIGEMLFCSISQLLSYEFGPDGQKGRFVGLYRTFYAASRLSAPALGAEIYQYFGGNILWYICGALGAVCFIYCTFMAKSYSTLWNV